METHRMKENKLDERIKEIEEENRVMKVDMEEMK